MLFSRHDLLKTIVNFRFPQKVHLKYIRRTFQLLLIKLFLFPCCILQSTSIVQTTTIMLSTLPLMCVVLRLSTIFYSTSPTTASLSSPLTPPRPPFCYFYFDTLSTLLPPATTNNHQNYHHSLSDDLHSVILTPCPCYRHHQQPTQLL